MFSLYPNITSIRLAQPEEGTWSAVRWLVFGLWGIALVLLARLVWRWTRVTEKDPDVLG